MKKIPLSQGQYTIVDDEDFEMLSKYKWYASRDRQTFYALRNSPSKKGRRKTIKMHRVIVATPEGFETDHKDGNGLNNQRANLRIATTAQNQHNRRKNIESRSGLKGVSWHEHSQKWHAQININGRRINLGYFQDKHLAFEAYVGASKQVYGDFARVQ